MGCYVNPKDCSKEEWLEENGMVLENIPFSGSSRSYDACIDNFADSIPVVLVDNGLFTAAGVCINKTEFDVMAKSEDNRFRYLYIVRASGLADNSDITQYEDICDDRVKDRLKVAKCNK